MTPAELLTTYDVQVRDAFADWIPTGWTATQDGPVTWCLTSNGGFVMAATGLEDLAEDQLAGLIDRTVAHYADLGRSCEWKTFDHDRAGFADLLLARSFEAEEHEALVIGAAADLAGEPVLPGGLGLRRVRERADLERIAALQTTVWGQDWGWLADDLSARVDDPGEPAVIYVVEDGEVLVSAAWLVPLAGTPFAGLWGGSTLPAYRGRGLYRALVARRAQEALDRGFTLLQVDASDDSRPILERLGLHVVGGTTPYIWTPRPGPTG